MPAVPGFSQAPSHWWLMVLTFCSFLWGTLSECPFTHSSACGSFHPFEATCFIPLSCLSKNPVYLLASNSGGAWLKPRSVEHLSGFLLSSVCSIEMAKIYLKKKKKKNISEVSWSSNQHIFAFAALMMMMISCVLVVKNENCTGTFPVPDKLHCVLRLFASPWISSSKTIEQKPNVLEFVRCCV